MSTSSVKIDISLLPIEWRNRSTVADLSYVPLAEAYLCPDCDVVGNCATRCPACGNEQGLASLAMFIDRQELTDISI